MKKIIKIGVLLLLPIFFISINFLPKEHGLFRHPFNQFLIRAMPVFAFIILPFLASRKYTFDAKKFVKNFLLLFIAFMIIIGVMGQIFGSYLGGFPREVFYMLVPLFLWMVVVQYRYVHYAFFLLIVLEGLNCMGRLYQGVVFPLNFGTVVFLPTLTFYSIYVLSEQYLKIKHSIAFFFALSYALIILGGMILDVSQLYVNGKGYAHYLKEYGGNYETLFGIGIALIIVGIVIFEYAAWVYFRVEEEMQGEEKK
ncbi:MAG TPA: hypothetical protein ENK66_04120 [Arcobacter sp.]|nr:hypothetical protein [Arcobacter sp.]